MEKKTDYYFEKAYQLSPKREDLIIAQVQGDIIQSKYQEAKEKALYCLTLNSASNYCWLLNVFSDIYLDNIEEAYKDMESAAQKDINLTSRDRLLQFENICEKVGENCFENLTDKLYSLSFTRTPAYYFDLIYVSNINGKEIVWKKAISRFLTTWRGSKLKLKEALDYLDNKEIINAYIDSLNL